MSTTTDALFSLQGQTALITGGTRGIGQAVAIALAEAGADILLVQRDTSNQTTKKAIEALGRKATIFTADLASPSDVAGILPAVLASGGDDGGDDGRPREVRILVNCAGIQRRHPSERFPDGDFAEVLQVNLSAPFALCRDAAAHMLSLAPLPATGRRGSIVNFASLLSFQGGVTVPAYAASKGGVAQMTKTFANEWTARGVTVNCVAPGYVATDMNEALLNDPDRLRSISERIPAGRWGAPEDFKGPVVFLASKAGGYVSGHTLVVDGGWMGR